MNDILLYLRAYHVNIFVVAAVVAAILVTALAVFVVTADGRQERYVKKFQEKWDREHPKEQA